MTKKQFVDNLIKANLSRKEFSKITGVKYNTIVKWNDDDRSVPLWVKSWLDNYIKVKCYEELRDKVLEIESEYNSSSIILS